MPNKYYWLKLKQDFFNSVRIKKLRSLAGGDTFTIIYLKMLLASMCDGGVIYFQNVEENIAEEIALLIDESTDNVSITINYLLKVGLAEVSENGLFLPEVKDLTGSETASAERMRRLRASQCDSDVTKLLQVSDVEKEIEKEKELEIELEIEKDNSSFLVEEKQEKEDADWEVKRQKAIDACKRLGIYHGEGT